MHTYLCRWTNRLSPCPGKAIFLGFPQLLSTLWSSLRPACGTTNPMPPARLLEVAAPRTNCECLGAVHTSLWRWSLPTASPKYIHPDQASATLRVTILHHRLLRPAPDAALPLAQIYPALPSSRESFPESPALLPWHAVPNLRQVQRKKDIPIRNYDPQSVPVFAPRAIRAPDTTAPKSQSRPDTHRTSTNSAPRTLSRFCVSRLPSRPARTLHLPLPALAAARQSRSPNSVRRASATTSPPTSSHTTAQTFRSVGR